MYLPIIMKDTKDKTVLEGMLDEYLEGEYRRNSVLVIGLSTVIFIFIWIVVAFILFIIVNFFAIGFLKDLLIDCQTFKNYISSAQTTQCTTKEWVSILINIGSFIRTACYLISPKYRINI